MAFSPWKSELCGEMKGQGVLKDISGPGQHSWPPLLEEEQGLYVTTMWQKSAWRSGCRYKTVCTVRSLTSQSLWKTLCLIIWQNGDSCFVMPVAHPLIRAFGGTHSLPGTVLGLW